MAPGFLSVAAHLQMTVIRDRKPSGQTLDKAQGLAVKMNCLCWGNLFFFLPQIVIETHSGNWKGPTINSFYVWWWCTSNY